MLSRKSTLQKSHVQSNPNAVKLGLESVSNDQARETCTFLISASHDEVKWRFSMTYNELVFLQLSLPDPWLKRMIPTFKVEKKFSSEVNVWLNELSEACSLSSQNNNFLLTSIGYSPDMRPRDINFHPDTDIITKLSPRVLRCGYLLKQSTSHSRHHSSAASTALSATSSSSSSSASWKSYYVVISDDLRYYESEAAYKSSIAPRGTIRLDCYSVIRSEQPNEMLGFTVMGLFTPPAVFRAASADDLECWCRILAEYPECV